MKENRDQAIRETLKWEGGYSNNPADPGGPTNWGITLEDARRYWKHDATADDVKNMPESVAVNIYATKYWVTQEYNCDNLSSGVDLAVFDFGVNSGPMRAYKYLMQSVGGSDADTINRLCDLRLAFLQQLRTWPTFGKGWSNRVEGIRSTALKMASIATEKPAGTSNSDQGSNTTPDQNKPLSDDDSNLGDKVDQAKSWWDRLKDWDVNWKEITRQAGILGSMVIGFISDHKIAFGILVTVIAAYALWNAMGRPQFWKVWHLPKFLRGY